MIKLGSKMKSIMRMVGAVLLFVCSCGNWNADGYDLAMYDNHMENNHIRGSGGANRMLQTTVGQITTFRLINVNTNTQIMDLSNNMVIDLSSLPSTSLSIEAVTTGTVGTLRFALNGKAKTEATAPWALCGDTNGIFKVCTTLVAGTHVLSGTPYSGTSSTGTVGPTQTITFTLTSSPVAPTVQNPTKVPTKTPTNAPVNTPVTKAPAKLPTNAPIKSPVTAGTCRIPQIQGTAWTNVLPKYPLIVKETQGLMIGNDIIIISGFTNGYDNATNRTYAKDVTNTLGSAWRVMDPLPVETGITHGATVRVGMKIYMCGGFYGGHPGRHIPDCFVYDHSIPPGNGLQWSRFASLPGKGSGGAGMIYDTAMNALYYATGGERNVAGTGIIDDVNTFFMYSFNNPTAGWVSMGTSPHAANHISWVTAYDSTGKEHHYFLGGQLKQNECDGNLDAVWEWDAVTTTWTRRANTPFPRGHAPSSTLPIGCGFIMAGGSINTEIGCFKKTSDISYYNIDTDTWTFIGNLTKTVNAPVCGIHNGQLYHVSENTFVKRGIIVPENVPTKSPLPAVPTQIPTRAPTKMPTTSPTKGPTVAPIIVVPTNAPTNTPIVPSATIRNCKIPQLVNTSGTSWSNFLPRHPLNVKETPGSLIGNDLIIAGGFTTNHTYVRDITDINSIWRRMDDIPYIVGITHMAFVVIGTKFYCCGGFYGRHPGRAVNQCWVYDHSVLPGFGLQWTRMSDLPRNGSAGAGMVYDTITNALYYVSGGQRLIPNSPDTTDIDMFVKYSFDSPQDGWVDMGISSPIVANHISSVTAIDKYGMERHYFLGGRSGQNDCLNQLGKVWEFHIPTLTWIERTDLPIPRGHASSSTLPIGCGFIIAGGSENKPLDCDNNKLSDISYYDTETNTWTSIGNLYAAVEAPVCVIGPENYLYHYSPNVMKRRQIIVPP